MDNFLSYISKSAPDIAAKLNGKKPGTTAFNNAWKQLASTSGPKFESVQHQFIQSTHYDPVASAVTSMGVNLNGRSQALRDVVWSVAVQHGTGGARTLLQRAIAGQPNADDATLIKRIYTERSSNGGKKYFPSSSEEIRNSVVNRFKSELKDALDML